MAMRVMHRGGQEIFIDFHRGYPVHYWAFPGLVGNLLGYVFLSPGKMR